MKRHVSLFVATVILAGCAASQAGGVGSPVPLASVDTEPSPLSCPYTEALRVPSPEMRVPLTFVVSAEGSVVPGSVRVAQSHHATPSESLQGRAMELILLCTYRPARVAGRPVAVRIQDTVYFPNQ